MGATGYASAVEGLFVRSIEKRCKSRETKRPVGTLKTPIVPVNTHLDSGLARSKEARNDPILGATGYASAVEGLFVRSIEKRCKSGKTQASGRNSRTPGVAADTQLGSGLTMSK